RTKKNEKRRKESWKPIIGLQLLLFLLIVFILVLLLFVLLVIRGFILFFVIEVLLVFFFIFILFILILCILIFLLIFVRIFVLIFLFFLRFFFPINGDARFFRFATIIIHYRGNFNGICVTRCYISHINGSRVYRLFITIDFNLKFGFWTVI